MSVCKRSNTYHLRRRVPARYIEVEPRKTIWVSLHTDSESVARRKAVDAWSQLIECWEAKLAGLSDQALERYEAARELADIRGFQYLDMNSVTRLPLEKIVTRIEAAELPAQEEVLGKVDATALLGTAEIPALTIEECLKLYWSLAKDKTLGKSADQLRRWKNPRKKAIRNFVSVIGNKPINAITRDDMLDFRQYWFEKIEAGSVTPNSANKDLIHLGDILKTVNKMKRLGLDLPLGELSFKEGEKSTRPPFSDDWIKTKLLNEHALVRLNSEARAILIGMINTGYRPSEACALTGDTIIFNHDVPHISIEPDGRQLKTRHARRKIPLTGVSLEIFKEHRSGFPRYRGKSGLSATVNKYLRDNGLLESPMHSMYSLRHAFEDRMLAAGIDDRIRRDVFGHALNRERYGRGASLEQVFNLLNEIAI